MENQTLERNRIKLIPVLADLTKVEEKVNGLLDNNWDIKSVNEHFIVMIGPKLESEPPELFATI